MASPLSCDQLRWRCDPTKLDFETTAEVEPIKGIVGQASAVESLRFGLEVQAPGQNVFIRGLTGTGRMTLVRRLLGEMQPQCPVKEDRCYVRNFSQRDRPRLISLPPGKGRAFRREMHRMAEFIRDDLAEALNAESIRARRDSLDRRAKEEIEKVTGPFEKDLREADLALVTLQLGTVAQTTIFPVHEGKPVPPEEYEQLHAQGKVSAGQLEAYHHHIEEFQKRLAEITEKVRAVRRRHAKTVQSMMEGTARAVLGEIAHSILAEFPGPKVETFLSEVVDDVIETRLAGKEESDPVAAYGANVVREHAPDKACPIIIENTPTLTNLLGTIDRQWTPQGTGYSDYRGIHAGSLLRADGGYLILDTREVILEPGAWKVLLRTLRTGMLEIVPPELSWPVMMPSIKPEPIPVNVKVILLGDSSIYYMLDRYDPDFGQLFKVLADFDSEIKREPEGVRKYAEVLARIAQEENLPPFDRGAVAGLAEHGARIASRNSKLTSRFGRVADIAREAAFLARKAGRETVLGEDVEQAVHRTKSRGDLPSRRFREMLADGSIRVATTGGVVGQINGLAVISAGPLTYGIPARITASIGAGSAGVVDIEGRAQLSGAIHTKGFNILVGLLRNLLRTDHPLAFSASLAFEQSYGGIDGDSASGAEICCLLSALTGIEIQQNFAMTGAVDQKGHLQIIGGVNEKIEGFFDTCRDIGLSGDQGVIIPRSNVGHLMLRQDVVDACARGDFHVYAVGTVKQALEILTGIPTGARDADGAYPEGTLLHTAVERAYEYWLKSVARPTFELEGFEEREEEEEDASDQEAEPAGDEEQGASRL